MLRMQVVEMKDCCVNIRSNGGVFRGFFHRKALSGAAVAAAAPADGRGDGFTANSLARTVDGL
jgi:hypothetical protein